MIVLYDYEGKSNEERARNIYTSVKELSDAIVAKILSTQLNISIEEATAMVAAGSRDKDNFWWSEDRRYSIEINNG